MSKPNSSPDQETADAVTHGPEAMKRVLDELVTLLSLERIEENLFRGQSQNLGWGAVFGGQVVGQALSAAVQTVPAERPVHSLHGYFLRSGDAKKPIVYEVDRIRDGKSFTTRRVVAVQNGKAIFNLAASFQIEEPGYEHADVMPKIEGPEGLESEGELWVRRAAQLPEFMRKRATAPRPIEIRPVEPNDPFDPKVLSANHAIWMRAASPVDDNPALHRFLLAYASDFGFITTAMRPHKLSWIQPDMQVASLDHAMLFHRPFRIDEWLLHVVESPSASGARGLVRGRFFSQSGELVASTMQEGLMRHRPNSRA